MGYLPCSGTDPTALRGHIEKEQACLPSRLCCYPIVRWITDLHLPCLVSEADPKRCFWADSCWPCGPLWVALKKPKMVLKPEGVRGRVISRPVFISWVCIPQGTDKTDNSRRRERRA